MTRRCIATLFLLFANTVLAQQRATDAQRVMPPNNPPARQLGEVEIVLGAPCGAPQSVGVVIDGDETIERRADRKSTNWAVPVPKLRWDSKQTFASIRYEDGRRRTDCRKAAEWHGVAGDPRLIAATFIFPECSEPLPKITLRTQGSIQMSYERSLPASQEGSVACESQRTFFSDRVHSIDAVWDPIEIILLQPGRKKWQQYASSLPLFTKGQTAGLLSLSRNRGRTRIAAGKAVKAKLQGNVLSAKREDIANGLFIKRLPRADFSPVRMDLYEQFMLKDLSTLEVTVNMPDGK